MSTPQDKPLLLLVDGHSLAFRSFYAFSKGGEGGLATKDGIPTSVTYGFLKALLDRFAQYIVLVGVHPYREYAIGDFTGTAKTGGGDRGGVDRDVFGGSQNRLEGLA